jgi:tetratricopeptide (TPR) repeat protein
VARLANKRTSDAQTLLDVLYDPTDPFTSQTVDEIEKDFNLSRSLRLSYEALDANGRRRFRALGAFAIGSTFDLPALAAVWDEPPARADRTAVMLINASLLDAAAEGGRYSQNRVLRTYARALLFLEGELNMVSQRHLTELSRRYGLHGTMRNAAAHPAITADWENVLTALNWGFRNAPKDACDLLSALTNYIRLYRSHAEQQQLYTDAFAAARRAKYTHGQANMLHSLGDLAMGEGDTSGAQERYAAALALYKAMPDLLVQANTLLRLGDLAMREGDTIGARERHAAALALFEAIPDRIGQANTLQSLGDLAMLEGDTPGARERYAAALALFEAIPDRLGQANTLLRLGDLAMLDDDYSGAREPYAAALALFEAIPDRLGQANTLKSLGNLAMREADTPGARERYATALALFEAIHSHLGQANTLQSLGDLAMREGNTPGASSYFSQALEIYQKIGKRVGQMNTLVSMARMARDKQDDADAAKRHFEALFALADTIPGYRDHPVTHVLRQEYAALQSNSTLPE